MLGNETKANEVGTSVPDLFDAMPTGKSLRMCFCGSCGDSIHDVDKAEETTERNLNEMIMMCPAGLSWIATMNADGETVYTEVVDDTGAPSPAPTAVAAFSGASRIRTTAGVVLASMFAVRVVRSVVIM